MVRLVRAATIAAALALLAGCSTIDQHTPAPAGWPDLLVIEHRTDLAGARAACRAYVGFLDIPLGCAVVNFNERTCNVWHVNELARRHELLHCAGHDHIGDSVLRDAFHAWTAYQLGQAAAAAGR